MAEKGRKGGSRKGAKSSPAKKGKEETEATEEAKPLPVLPAKPMRDKEGVADKPPPQPEPPKEVPGKTVMPRVVTRADPDADVLMEEAERAAARMEAKRKKASARPKTETKKKFGKPPKKRIVLEPDPPPPPPPEPVKPRRRSRDTGDKKRAEAKVAAPPPSKKREKAKGKTAPQKKKEAPARKRGTPAKRKIVLEPEPPPPPAPEKPAPPPARVVEEYPPEEARPHRHEHSYHDPYGPVYSAEVPTCPYCGVTGLYDPTYPAWICQSCYSPIPGPELEVRRESRRPPAARTAQPAPRTGARTTVRPRARADPYRPAYTADEPMCPYCGQHGEWDPGFPGWVCNTCFAPIPALEPEAPLEAYEPEPVREPLVYREERSSRPPPRPKPAAVGYGEQEYVRYRRPKRAKAKHKIDVPGIVLFELKGCILLFWVYLLLRFELIPYHYLKYVETALLIIVVLMVIGMVVKVFSHSKKKYKSDIGTVAGSVISGFIGIYAVFYLAKIGMIWPQHAVMFATAIGIATGLGLFFRYLLSAFSGKG